MVAQPVPLAVQRRLTRAEYDRMADLGFFREERVELIHGIVVRMSPIGPSHCNAVDRLMEALVPVSVGRLRVRIQQPFLAWDDSEPEPDVALVPQGDYGKQHPDRALLIVEVTETSLEYDSKTKGPLYAASGVPEYWVVDMAGRCVEILTAPTADGYTNARVARQGQVISPGALPEAKVSVSDLFV